MAGPEGLSPAVMLDGYEYKAEEDGGRHAQLQSE